MGLDKRVLPLQHVRAVVLTQAWAGALTTQLLADMGAEVIQIEALERPDVWRGGYPPRNGGTYPENNPGERPYNRNANYNTVNRNKLGITLDLTTEEGKGLFLELVSISDIVAENFATRVMANFGLEYAELKRVNPSIIMIRMPAFGLQGPYAHYPGNGGTTEPMTGMTSLLGYKDGVPLSSGIMHTDAIGGEMGFAALLIALHHRHRTGQGQEIELSQQEAAISFIGDHVVDYTMTGRVPQRQGNRDRWMAPHGNYRCKGEDSWVAISVRSDAEWQRLCILMGRQELAEDARFLKTEERLANADALDRLVEDWTLDKEAYPIMELLQGQGIPCAPVLKASEVLDSPQLQARGFFETVHHPEAGTHQMPGMPWRLSRTPGSIRLPAPCLGEHSRRVLMEHLGLTETDLADLEQRGITGQDPPID